MKFHTILYSYAQVTAVLFAMRSVAFAGPGKHHDRHDHQHENHGSHRVPPSSSPTRLITCPDQCTHPRTIRAGITKFVANCTYNTGSTAPVNQLCDGNQLTTKYFGDFGLPSQHLKKDAKRQRRWILLSLARMYMELHTPVRLNCPSVPNKRFRGFLPRYLGMLLPERPISLQRIQVTSALIL